jgi:hypothetical protein
MITPLHHHRRAGASAGAEMPTERTPMTWQIVTSEWGNLSAPQRTRYAAIVASYGGTDRVRGGFTRYRVAEACARSIRSELGLETVVDLGPAR